MVEVEADILSEVINCTGYHKPATEFGERAWLAEGKDVDVIYWDEGNNWCPMPNNACYSQKLSKL
jgi:hypothetical protein